MLSSTKLEYVLTHQRLLSDLEGFARFNSVKGMHEPSARHPPYGFHNAHFLRAPLPRDLIAPIPLFANREAKHHELATELRQQLTTRKRKRGQEDGDEEGNWRPQKTSEEIQARAEDFPGNLS
ncbi:hypothetical protein B0H14DRAFT_2580921 [Mycena olivaceomarginata]|nr:hypothetical protein B0H14DRAFT_2580921 [Mycena olivaceomarginata]